MADLLTIDEVALMLHKSVRTVKRRPIPYSRDGATRLYDRRDVDKYLLEVKECLSSSGRDPRIITRNSKSEAIGFAEALAKAPSERRGLKKEPSKKGRGRSSPASQQQQMP